MPAEQHTGGIPTGVAQHHRQDEDDEPIGAIGLRQHDHREGSKQRQIHHDIDAGGQVASSPSAHGSARRDAATATIVSPKATANASGPSAYAAISMMVPPATSGTIGT